MPETSEPPATPGPPPPASRRSHATDPRVGRVERPTRPRGYAPQGTVACRTAALSDSVRNDVMAW
jgi:hypothetical protein